MQNEINMGLRLFFPTFESIVFSFLSLIVACEDATNCSGHETCRGSGRSWNCCTIESKCGIHEGDCDSDEECESTLTCGIGNCAVHLFPENADCCQEPGNVAKNQVTNQIFSQCSLKVC